MTLAFLDSNILVYAFDEDGHRTPIARNLLRPDSVISVQSLNEFANVARRKLGFDWPEIVEAVAAIEALVPMIVPLTTASHHHGIGLAARYRLSVYDGLIVAAALEAGCSVLYSEDMHHGLVIDGRLTVTDPFRV